jgi:alpha-beta hydrolase superfamily lysophospholipase
MGGHHPGPHRHRPVVKPAAESVTTAAHVASIDHFIDTISRRYARLPIVLVGHSYRTVAFARSVRVPVLDVVGDHDYLYAGDDPKAFVPDQKRAFSSASRVDVVLIKNAAHDLALHRNAVQTNDLINRWAAANA